jgi:ribosomal protein S13
MKVPNLKNENAPSPTGEDQQSDSTTPNLTQEELKDVLTSIKGIGDKKFNKIINKIGQTQEVVGVLEQSPSILLNIKGFTKKLIKKVEIKWEEFKKSLEK